MYVQYIALYKQNRHYKKIEPIMVKKKKKSMINRNYN